MQMRLKNGKWYAAFYWKGKFIGNCLGVPENKPKKAAVELGKLIEKLEGGDETRKVLKKFKSMIPDYRDLILSGKSESYQKRSGPILKHL